MLQVVRDSKMIGWLGNWFVKTPTPYKWPALDNPSVESMARPTKPGARHTGNPVAGLHPTYPQGGGPQGAGARDLIGAPSTAEQMARQFFHGGKN
jgi:hypothetical protein